ncbi:MAG TPA: PspC domain-containing protein [Vicinamibacterales bacterium]
MQKVITINLNGNAYQIDERGYAALVAYLEQAEQQLAGNPDRAEILADLEQAIAEKCQRFLSAQKNVVTAAEVDQIIAEMGPVERPSEATAGAGASGATDDRARSSGAPRRLYLVKEGAMIAGVCNGIAAFIGIDATIVRVVFLVLLFLTKGFWALVYGVLMFVIPSANTAEERAAAHGEPFNAQELIDRAKKGYADIGGPTFSWGWLGNWRREHRAWRRQHRAARRAVWWPPPPVVPAPHFNYATRIGAGLMIPIFSLVSVLAFMAFAYACASLVMSREAFGRPLPLEVPLWLGLLVVFLAYNAISWPLRTARRASYFAVGGYHYGMVAAWDGVLSVGFAIVIAWIAYQTMPEVHDLVNALPGFWDVLRTTWDR